MAKSTRGGRRAGQAGTTRMANPVANATNMTDGEAQQLRDDQDDMYIGTVSDAIKLYISNTNADGNNYSKSQILNFLDRNGIDVLNATTDDINNFYKSIGSSSRISDKTMADLQIMAGYLPTALHPIGKDTVLYRGSHVGDLAVFGITDTSVPIAQLKKQLVGGTLKNDAMMSTSYDASKSPFLNGAQSGGREIVYEIRAGKNTQVFFGAKKQAEIVIGKGHDFRVVDVQKTGQTAYPRQGRAMDQIKIVLETF